MSEKNHFRAGNFGRNLPYFISGCAVIALNIYSLYTAVAGIALGILLLLSALYFENIYAFWKSLVTPGILLLSGVIAFLSAVVFYELFSMTAKTEFVTDLVGMSQRTFFLIPAVLGGAGSVYFLSVVLCVFRTAARPKEKSAQHSHALRKPDMLGLGILLAMMLLAGAFLTSQKVSFHVDDMLTFVLSNSYFQPFIEEPSADGGIVITGEEFAEFLTASDHPFSYGSVIYNQIQDQHPPLYYFFIHTVSSLLPGLSLKAVGYLVNALFAALTLVCLFVWAYSRFDRPTAYLMAAGFAFGVNTYSMLIFFRMYVMFLYFTVLLAVCLYEIYAGNRERRVRVWLGLALCLGAMTHYYFLVYAFFSCLVLAILMCVEKRWEDLKDTSVIVGVSACIYYSIWGNIAIRHILSGYQGQQAIGAAMALKGTIAEIRVFIDLLLEQIFSRSFLSIGFFVILAVFIIILAVMTARVGKEKNTYLRGSLLLLLPCLLYVCMIAKVSVAEKRYIANVIPLFWVGLAAVLYYTCREIKCRTALTAVLTALIIVDSLTASAPEYLYLSDESMVEYMESLGSDTVCVYFKSTNWNSQAQYAALLMNYQTTYVVNASCLDWLKDQELWENDTVLLLAEDSAGYEELFASTGCTDAELIGAYERVWVYELSR